MIDETYSIGGVLYHHGIQGMHWGVQNGPPYPLSKSISTGSRLKESTHGSSNTKKVNPKYKPISYSDIKKDDEHDVISQDVNFKDHKTEVYTFTDYNDALSDDELKKAAKIYGNNAEEFTKSAFKAIKNDKDIYELWAEPLGISEKDFYDRLAIRGLYVTKINDKMYAEVNVYEKDDKDDILGGHSLDMEFYLKNPKKVPKWVAMNG